VPKSHRAAISCFAGKTDVSSKTGVIDVALVAGVAMTCNVVVSSTEKKTERDADNADVAVNTVQLSTNTSVVDSVDEYSAIFIFNNLGALAAANAKFNISIPGILRMGQQYAYDSNSAICTPCVVVGAACYAPHIIQCSYIGPFSAESQHNVFTVQVSYFAPDSATFLAASGGAPTLAVQFNASTSSTTSDNNLQNNQLNVVGQIALVADLRLSFPPDTQVNAGSDTPILTLTVCNYGPAAATAVTFDWNFPAEFQDIKLVFKSIDEASCTFINPLLLRCNGFTLDKPIVTDTVTVIACGEFKASAHVSASAGGSAAGTGANAIINQTALGSSSVLDLSPSNNFAIQKFEIIVQQDVAITKVGPISVAIGASSFFIIGVTNAGPAQAYGVLVQDEMPLPFLATSAVPSQGSCTVTNQRTISCLIGSMSPVTLINPPYNTSVTIVVRYIVPANANPTVLHFSPNATSPNAIINFAHVYTTSTDKNLTNNVEQAPVDIYPITSVSIAKDCTLGPFVSGKNNRFNYTLTIGNGGPADARAIVLTDTFPAEVAAVDGLIYISNPSVNCSIVGQRTLTCNYAALAPSSSFTVSVTVQVLPGLLVEKYAVNTATVSTTATAGAASETSTFSATCKTKIQPPPSVTITKVASVSQIVVDNPDDVFQYTIVLINNGPVGADNVGLLDTVPYPFEVYNTALIAFSGGNAGSVFSYATNCGSNSGGNVLNCNFGSLDSGRTITIVVPFKVNPAAAAGSYTNSANVTALLDSNLNDNQANATIALVVGSNVYIVKSGNGNCAGLRGSFSFQYGNTGPAVARGAKITDQIDPRLVVTAGDLPANCAISTSNLVTCTLGDLPVSAFSQGVITFGFGIPAGLITADGTGNTTISNTATISSNTFERPEDVANDFSTVTIPVRVCFDAAVTKTGVSSVIAGRSVDSANVPYQFTMTVRNNGPSNIINMQLVDKFPLGFVPGVAVVTTNNGPATPGSCAPLGQGNDNQYRIQCTFFGTFDTTRIDTVTVPFSVYSDLAAGVYVNVVDVTAPNALNTGDTNLTNNHAEWPVNVNVRAPLTITKNGPPTCVLADGITRANFVISITNSGPSLSRNIVFTDDVPAPFVIDSPPGAVATFFNGVQQSCGNGNALSCTFAQLPAGQSVTIVYSASIPSSAFNQTGIRNTATATAVQSCDAGAVCSATTVSTFFDSSVCAQADLRIVKSNTAPIDGYVAGGPGPYTFTVKVFNDGPSTAYNVVANDFGFQGGVITSVVDQASGAACNTATLRCNYASLDNGGVRVIVVTFSIPPAQPCGPYTNYANVSSSTFDPNTGNNQDQSSISVIAKHTVTISKTGATQVVAGGGSYTHVVTISNNGPSVATVVHFTDAVPSPLVVTSVSCGAVSQNLDCTFNNLGVNSVVTVTYTFTVASNAPLGTVTNTARFVPTSGCETELNATPFSNLPVTVVCVDSLSVFKTDSVDVIVAGTPGETFLYTLSVTNSGPSDASNVVVNDVFPTQLTRNNVPFTSNAQFPCSFSASTGSIHCEWLSPLPKGTTVYIYQNFSVASNVAPQTVPNTITAQSQCSGSSLVSYTSTTVILNNADLAITKDDCRTEVVAGDVNPTTFSLLVENFGPSDGVNVIVEDLVPFPYNNVQYSIKKQPGFTTGTCILDARFAGTFIRCTFASFPVGETAIILVSATVPYDVPEGNVTNCATVYSQNPNLIDPVPRNNEDCDTNRIVNLADLVATKRLVAPPNPECEIPGGLGIVAGSTLLSQYIVSISNLGPSLARSVSFVEVFPAGVIIQSAPANCTQVGASNTFKCVFTNPSDLAPLPTGHIYEFPFTFYVASSTPKGIISNFVSVTSTTRDPDLCNNNFTLVSPICAVSDLSITKDDGERQVTAGDGVLYKYTVSGTNYGPSDAAMVQVEDVWPLWTTRGTMPGFVIDHIEGATCNETASGFVCNIGTVAAGSSYSFCIFYRVDSCLMACQMCNVVAVSSMSVEPRPDPHSNLAEDCNDVRTEADLQICKSDGVEVVTAGDNIIYTYEIKVSNKGPSCARDVKIVDHFPSQIPQVAGSLTTSVGSCVFEVNSAVVGKDFSCNLGLFRVGDNATVKISYTVPSSLTACSVINIVTVSSTTFDPVQCNNDAKDVNAVIESAVLSVNKVADTPTIPVTYRGPHNYVITVTNNGPSTAHDVVLTDLWPATLCQYGERLQLEGSNGGGCVTTGGDITCLLGDLAQNGVITITIPFSVCDKATAGVVNNVVSVFSPTASKCFDKTAAITLVDVVNRRRENAASKAKVIQAAAPLALPEAAAIVRSLTVATVPEVTMPPMDPRLAPVLVQMTATRVSDTVFKVVVTNTNKYLTVRMFSLTGTGGELARADLTATSDLVASTTCKSFVGRKLPSMWTEECTVTFAKPVAGGIQISAVGVAKTTKGFAPVHAVTTA
jgi:uncharacterized repeat protein (TIGR01451 family)